MNVPLTQFLRPNGRQVTVTCKDVNDNLQKNYDEIKANGLRLACEELSTGVVSIALEHDLGDYDMELCQNKPDAPKQALEKLIERFNLADFKHWLNEQSTEEIV
jgi:hypothetical protein